MCVIAIQEYERAEDVPGDLRLWLGESGLVNLVRNVVQDAPLTVPARSNYSGADSEGRRMLTLVTSYYAAGKYGSAEIEWASCGESMVGAAGGRDYPSSAATIIQFRRNYRHQIEACLAEVLAAAWRSRPGAGLGVVMAYNSELECWALTEARRRVQLAVVMDLGLSE